MNLNKTRRNVAVVFARKINKTQIESLFHRPVIFIKFKEYERIKFHRNRDENKINRRKRFVC